MPENILGLILKSGPVLCLEPPAYSIVSPHIRWQAKITFEQTSDFKPLSMNIYHKVHLDRQALFTDLSTVIYLVACRAFWTAVYDINIWKYLRQVLQDLL